MPHTIHGPSRQVKGGLGGDLGGGLGGGLGGDLDDTTSKASCHRVASRAIAGGNRRHELSDEVAVRARVQASLVAFTARLWGPIEELGLVPAAREGLAGMKSRRRKESVRMELEGLEASVESADHIGKRAILVVLG